jgi:hypothetical protein
MATEVYDSFFPCPGAGKRILKAKIDLALGATGALAPYPQNTERQLERKILRQIFPGEIGSGGLLLVGLMHYIESSDFDGQANNTVVNTWPDKTGKGNNWINASAVGLDPFVDTTRTLNGHVTIRFPNNANAVDFNIPVMKCTNLFIPATGVQGLEVMCIYKLDNDPATTDKFAGCPFRFQEVGFVQGIEGSHTPYTDGNFYEMFAQNGRPSFGNPVTSVATAFVCYGIGVNGIAGDLQAWINSENFYNASSYSFRPRGVETVYRLGSFGADAEDTPPNVWQITGNIAALYLYDHKLTNQERSVQRTYITNKWGITFP